ncbi:MFS transporter [Alkalihalobacillus oceani]|uniref:MFS transporter n=1 Tax=Halalkalibacter oceani TaxID=1653776 RepID=A0A9X2DSJ9_9BACI|nr:MFS transporter [Halalkalibacter oceani]MCM3716174.1 MFS transporter [Halalkalibacter oceani]
MGKTKLWTKDFISISLASFFIFLIFYMLMVTLPIYIVESLAGGGQSIGLNAALFVIAAIVFRPFAGNWLQSVGQKKTLLIGTLIFVAGSFLYFFASTIFLLLVLRILHGVGFGIATTATGGIVATVIPRERRGEGMGYYATFMNLAMVIGPFLGLSFIHSWGYTFLMVLCAVFSCLALICALLVNVADKSAASAEVAAVKQRVSLAQFFEKRTFPIAIVAFVLAFVYSGVLSFISVYAEELNLIQASSFFFVVYATFLLISRPFTGRWFDLYGENKVIYPCIIVFAVGVLVLSQVGSGWMLLLAGGLIGLGFGTLFSSFQAIAIQASPPERAGVATATFFVLFDSGFAIGSFLLGIMATYLEYADIYLACSVLVLLSTGLYYFFHGRKARREKAALSGT